MLTIYFLGLCGTLLLSARAQSTGGSVIIADSRIGEISTSAGGDTFTGSSWIDDVCRDDDGTITTVAFEPGARTFWHHHEGGQVLRVLAGTGWIATRWARDSDPYR
ncbi:uncharacterized protein DNG_04686 [Cephalotrichum gorgonifer]|uniref:Cupin n=1 Tax=Cephalotrichum gorgonifer TaxID=2041049 RepID=A0AAE8MXJ0_9PEZI|nr:uncharacterized protein DNG_04686 [Cephalotrichum gorgonifer]